MREKEITDMIFEEVNGMDISDAFERIDKIMKECKDLILQYSPVSFPWDRVKEEDIKNETK